MSSGRSTRASAKLAVEAALDISGMKDFSDLKDIIPDGEGLDKTAQIAHDSESLSSCLEMLGGEDPLESPTLAVDLKDKSVVVLVKTLQDKCFSVLVNPMTNIAQLKEKVFEMDSTWEVPRQRIIFKGKELYDPELILNCGLCDSIPTVHVVMRPSPSGVTRRRKDHDVEKSVPTKTRARCSARSVSVKVKDEPDEDKNRSGGSSKEGEDYRDFVLPMEFDPQWPSYELGAAQTDLSQISWEGDGLVSPTSSTSSKQSKLGSSVADLLPAGRLAANENERSSREAPVIPSSQGRAYDLSKVDEKLRKRLVKNRLSAERSRQRKQAHVETLEFELSCCRSENEHLRQRVALLEAQLAAFSLGSQGKPSFCPQIPLAVHA